MSAFRRAEGGDWCDRHKFSCADLFWSWTLELQNEKWKSHLKMPLVHLVNYWSLSTKNCAYPEVGTTCTEWNWKAYSWSLLWVTTTVPTIEISITQIRGSSKIYLPSLPSLPLLPLPPPSLTSFFLSYYAFVSLVMEIMKKSHFLLHSMWLLQVFVPKKYH